MAAGTYTPDNLVADIDLTVTTEIVTIKQGEVHTRGTVLGKITADEKYIMSLSAAVDGSQVPKRILAEDVDATAGDVEAIVYKSGAFNVNFMTLGTAHTFATIKDPLWTESIEVRDDAIKA